MTYRSLPLWIAAMLAISSLPALAQVPSCALEATAGQNVTATNVAGAIDVSTSGLIGGGGVLCDWKFQGFVVGAFGRYEFTSADGSLAGLKIDSKGLWTAGLRGGVLINPSTLLYAFGGVAGSDMNLATFKDNTFGYAFGAGAEFALPVPNLSAKIEYQQTIFDTENVGPLAVDPVSHVGRVGLVYRFSGSIFGQ